MNDDRGSMPPMPAGDEQADREPGEPVFNIPAILIGVIAVMLAIYVVQSQVLSASAEDWFVTQFSFRPDFYTPGVTAPDIGWLVGPVSYSLLHGSFAHVGFNSVWLAVFGTPVARRLGPLVFVLFWVASAIASAFFFAVTTSFEPSYLIGASGVVSATSGAVCRFAITSRGFAPAHLTHLAPRLSILGALAHRTVLVFVGFSLVSNLLVAVGMSGGPGDNPVAWQAHIGGFLFGYLFFGLFDRRRR